MKRPFLRGEPTTFGKCLAIHMAAADRWPRRNRLPRTALAKIGHLAVGAALGATAAAIVIEWIRQ
jgi:hypothetical protein